MLRVEIVVWLLLILGFWQNSGEISTSNCVHQYSRSSLPKFPTLQLLYKQIKCKWFLHTTYIKSFWDLHTVIFLICLLRCSPVSVFIDCPEQPFAQTCTHILGVCATRPSRYGEFELGHTPLSAQFYVVLPLCSSWKLMDGWEVVLLTDELSLSITGTAFRGKSEWFQ